MHLFPLTLLERGGRGRRDRGRAAGGRESEGGKRGAIDMPHAVPTPD